VIREFACRSVRRLLLAGLLAGASPPLLAQSVSANDVSDWRGANDIVGRYGRGHADVLKWEESNLAVEPIAKAPVGRIVLSTPDAAVREAWNAHIELANALATLGSQAAEHVAAGRLNDIDPDVRRRVHDIDEILDVATDARKAWISAVAARQALKNRKDALRAAGAASELGARMALLGNWSRLQEARVRIGTETAQIETANTGYARATAQADLLRSVRLIADYSDVDIPEELPALPVSAWSEKAVQQRIEALEKVLPCVCDPTRRWRGTPTAPATKLPSGNRRS